jgi:IstB-like ATP binding protein
VVNELAEAAEHRRFLAPSPATAAAACSASTSSDARNSTGAAPSCRSRFSPNGKNSAIAIASNGPFSAWTKTFTDSRLCAAIVNRLTFAGQIIETGTTSYRLAAAAPGEPASQTRPSTGMMQRYTTGPPLLGSV